MRFIFYFIFFGLLFYAISVYFPEAFHTLVSWAAKTFDFLYHVASSTIEKINDWSGSHSNPIEVPKPSVPNT